MTTLGEIFRRYGPAYRARFGRSLSERQLQAMQAIAQCRTEALGGHVYTCLSCQTNCYSDHSCRNRHCPTCQQEATQAWLAEQHALLLPVPYFLVTVTLPSELRAIGRQQPETLYPLLFRTSAAALQQLAQDPRFLGGRIAMLGVLQTWTRDLRDHPHVHYLVPALALTPDGTRWLVGKSAFLLHVKPLGERVEGEGPRGLASDAVGRPGRRACLGQAMGRGLPTRRQWRECLNVSRPLDLPPCAEQQPPRGGRKWGGHVRYTEGKNGCAETGHAAPRHLHRTVSCAGAAERVVKGRAYGLLRPRKRQLPAEAWSVLALGQAAPPPPRAAAAPGPLVATPERAVGRCPSCGQPMQLVQTLQPQRHRHQMVTSVGEPSSRGPPIGMRRTQSVAS